MGVISLPSSGRVYIDTMILIYTVERFSTYWRLIEPIWIAAQSGQIEIVSSELTILESLVGPLKSGNKPLLKIYENALFKTELRLIPITQSILREAANLRATTSLRTPDGLHGATASSIGCSMFITNDSVFRKIPKMLSVVILDDLLKP